MSSRNSSRASPDPCSPAVMSAADLGGVQRPRIARVRLAGRLVTRNRQRADGVRRLVAHDLDLTVLESDAEHRVDLYRVVLQPVVGGDHAALLGGLNVGVRLP